MRAISTLCGTAALGAALALTVPAAHAAAPQPTTTACARAVADAQTAEAAYSAAVEDYKKTIAVGGHPGTAEQDNVTKLEIEANAAASTAARACPDAKVPSGTMHTGVGSTSEGTNIGDLAAGGALIGAVGIGALMLRRRHNGDQI
ncbi:hypothetical protein [Streptomyces sp. H39-S7]|uniref:hypothetical protein n=1 Tax=Streptomyces sp. H39-S7 TaxID=3004357 RepID=UPI0022AFE06B|nr:hypothetical protein [Streptomyces sp. H39-S7]MCZ4119837.1 hypothetical protein [Streptomyces sp. H39-S7]